MFQVKNKMSDQEDIECGHHSDLLCDQNVQALKSTAA